MKKAIGFDDVRKMAEGLEGVEVGTIYGKPALRVRGKMFTCIPSHKSAEPDTLVAVISFDDRDQLLEAEPKIYYLKDHYRPYPSILVRLREIHRDALRDLLQMAWRFVSANARAARRPISRRRLTSGRRGIKSS